MTPETQVRTLAQRILDFDYGYADQTNTEWRAIVNEARAMTTNTRGSTPATWTANARGTDEYGTPLVAIYGSEDMTAVDRVRLVQAAPQLLQALRVIEWGLTPVTSYVDGAPSMRKATDDELREQARAALKAAEGE